MKVCGVELKGSEAAVCLLSKSDGLFSLPDCRVRSIGLVDAVGTLPLREFQFAFAKLMADYHVEKVVIRERPLKGKYAGGAVGFKMEAAIQLIEGLEVEVLTAAFIKESLKQNPLPIDFADTGLKSFQEVAFVTAFASFGEESRAAEIKPKELKPKELKPKTKSAESMPVEGKVVEGKVVEGKAAEIKAKAVKPEKAAADKNIREDKPVRTGSSLYNPKR
jgi:hypothetical protein